MNILWTLAAAIYLIIVSLFSLYDSTRYEENTPYKPSKKKESLISRIILGIKAGFHYSQFIGTYDHKKYNTQVHYPTTLECYIGGIFAIVFEVAYIILALGLKEIFGNFSLIILVIPIITNLISIIKKNQVSSLPHN